MERGIWFTITDTVVQCSCHNCWPIYSRQDCPYVSMYVCMSLRSAYCPPSKCRGLVSVSHCDLRVHIWRNLTNCLSKVSFVVVIKGKGKGFPYSTPSVGPGADPGVQAVSPQVTESHTPGGRLPLLSARPAVTSPAAEHHRPLAGTKLYCLVTEAHGCKQLA